MIKEFFLRKLIESKLGALPKEDRERIIAVITKNPELFEEIGKKIKAKVDGGMDQMKATMSVMEEYKPQLQKLMASK